MPLDKTEKFARAAEKLRQKFLGKDAVLTLLRDAEESGYEVVAEIPTHWYFEQAAGQNPARFYTYERAEGDAAKFDTARYAAFKGKIYALADRIAPLEDWLREWKLITHGTGEPWPPVAP